MKYKVTLCQEVWNYYEVEVEAADDDQACKIAVKDFREKGPHAFNLSSEEPQHIDVVCVT